MSRIHYTTCTQLSMFFFGNLSLLPQGQQFVGSEKKSGKGRRYPSVKEYSWVIETFPLVDKHLNVKVSSNFQVTRTSKSHKKFSKR